MITKQTIEHDNIMDTFICPLHRFVMLKCQMTEMDFLYVHQGVVDQVVAKGTVKRLLGMFKMMTFARKIPRASIESDVHVEEDAPQHASYPPGAIVPSTSSQSPKNIKSAKKGKGRGKSTSVAQPNVPPIPIVQSKKSEVVTQTDVDFEYYLEMDEQEYQDYQAYQHAQMTQRFLVSEIREEDFEGYD